MTETPIPAPGHHLSADRRPDTLFFGPDGLRAGWSLLLFFAILAPLVVGLIDATKRWSPPPPRAASSKQAEARPSSPGQLLIPEAAQLALLSIATFAMSKIERRPMAAYGMGPAHGGLRYFAAGAFWGLVCLSLLILLLVRTRYLVFDARLLFGPAVLRYGAIWLFGFLLVGLLEEYFVRGYLQFTLARGLTGLYEAGQAPHSGTLGFWTAALLLSILFGLGHGSNPGESPIGLLSAGLGGLVFVYSLWRTGSLLWAIGFHTTWDWAQSFLYGVADSGTTVQGHLFATHPVGSPLRSGGTTGPEGSVFILPTLALVALIIRFTVPRHQSIQPSQDAETF